MLISHAKHGWLFVSERKQIAMMADEKPPARISHRLFATSRSEMRIIMINFNNRKNKKILTAVIILFLVVAMVVPMIVSALLSFY